MPDGYRERYTNVQAALGLAGLNHLDAWTAATRTHAGLMDAALSSLPGVHVPYVPPDVEHVYYQYCVYAPDRDSLVRRALRHGVDVETLHVDVCSMLPLFGEHQRTPNAEAASQVVQLPVYASLSDRHARLVATTMRRLLETDPASGMRDAGCGTREVYAMAGIPPRLPDHTSRIPDPGPVRISPCLTFS